jgi:single-stranded DNA-binding protein
VNRIDLVGDLVSPVELRRDRITGRTFGKTIIAVPHGLDGVDFVPVTLVGREAIDAAKYLGDGSSVAVRGHLHSGAVAERDGDVRRRRLVVVLVDRVTYLVVRPARGGGRP